MIRSRSRLKDKMIELYKLYIKDTIMFLGNSKIYPLRPIADSIVTCAHATYNGNNLIAQTITIVYNGETLIKNVDYVIVTNNGGINAGDYIVKFKGINNYDGEVTGTFTIDKAVGIIITAPEAKNLTYNGTALNLVTAGSGTGTMMYKLGNNNWSSNIPTAINAGSYTVQFKAAESANYLESSVSSTIITIAKADPSCVAPSAKTLTYNTSALTLLNAGSTNHGTIQYSSNNSTWSTTIPTGTNVGTYTTYWRIIGDSNHNDKDLASIKTTISAKIVSNPTITLSQSSYTYDGTVKLPSITSVKDGSTVISSSEYTVSYSNNINVGTATVTITDKLGGNYTVSGSKTFTITKANPTYTAPTGKTGLVYNGNNLNLLNAGSTNHGTILYSSNNSTWSTSIPLTKNAGDYTLYWRLIGDSNHNDISSTSIAASVAKANQNAPTATGATTTYNTTATASASGGGGQGSIEWESVLSQTSVGSHTTRARWTGNSNYNASPWSNTVTVKMDKATGSSGSVSNPAAQTYQTSSTYSYQLGISGATGTVTYPTSITVKNSGGTAVSGWTCTSAGVITVPKNTGAGSYTVTGNITVAAATNYNAVSATSKTWTITINKAALGTLPTPTNWSGPYNNAWHNATFSAMSGASITKYRYYSTDNSNWTEISGNPQRQSAGTMYVQAYYTPDSNHSGGGWSSTATVAISKIADSISVWATYPPYTGNAQDLVAASGGHGTVHFKLNNGSWSTSIPKATASGTYTVYYYMDSSTNYNGVGSSSSPKSVKAAIGAFLGGPDSITVTSTSGTTSYGFVSTNGGTVSVIDTGSYITSASVEGPDSQGNGYVNFTYSRGSGQTTYITIAQSNTDKTLTTYITLP